MRRRWIAVLPMAVALVLGLGAVPALATGPAAADEDAITYQVETVSRVAGTADSVRESDLHIACRGEACRLVALPGYVIDTTDAPASFTVPGRLQFTSTPLLESCDPAQGITVHVALEFTETTVPGTSTIDELTTTCNGVESLVMASTMTYEGAIAEGQCHFAPGGCGGTAAAATDTAATTLEYAVTTQMSWTGYDGSSGEQGTRETTMRLTCAGKTCTPVAGDLLRDDLELHAFAVPGNYQADRPDSGSLCTGDYELGAYADFTFTADGVTGYRSDTPAFADCGGPQAAARGFDETIIASALVEGDCWFTADGCGAAASAEPDPVETGEPVVDDLDASGTDTNGDPQGTFSQLASGDPAAPSVLSALRPPAEAAIAPQQLALAALITVILVLLMSFPTSLLNSAIDGASDKLAARRERRGATKPATWTKTWWWAAIGVLAAAVISAFVDPQLGNNPGSLRVIASIAVGFALDVVLGWVILQWVMRRIAPDATRSFSFKPLSLLIVVAAVVFTRLTGFEPGIVFGLIAGLGFATALGARAKARAVLVPIGYSFVLGLLAWFVYGLVAERSGASMLETFLVETLSSLVVGGMVALPLALVPVKGLSGHTVWQSSRRLWAATYAVGLLAFFIVLMPMPFSWGEVGWELWAWIGVYVAYAAIAVTAWLLVKQPWRKDQEQTAQPSPAMMPADARADQEAEPASAPRQGERS